MATYADAVRVELRSQHLRPATSVFFGGGTPSLLPAEELAGILATIVRVPGAEVTVECNPDTVSASLLRVYHDAGVTRISLGAQSMVPHVLAALGRSHDPANVRAAVASAAVAGIERVNVDLIFGAVGESDDDWQASLDEIVALGVSHVSAYALTVEPGTPLALDPARRPDDDIQANRYATTEAALSAAGLRNYEISNWARPGLECRHNLLYWTLGEYVGVGCAAHSHRAGRRWWNVRTPERYIELVMRGESPIGGCEQLDDGERAVEAIQLGLRTPAGVDLDALGPPARAEATALTERGLLVERDGRVALTVSGRLLANEVAVRLT